MSRKESHRKFGRRRKLGSKKRKAAAKNRKRK